jgi:excisionase family DNA binding protein
VAISSSSAVPRCRPFLGNFGPYAGDGGRGTLAGVSQSSASTNELMTPREVAERLAVTERHVQYLAYTGRLPRVRIGPKTPRFRRADVERLIADGYEGDT